MLSFLGLSPSLWRIVVDYTPTLVRNKPSYGWTGAMCRFMHARVHHTWPLPKEEQEEDFQQLLEEAVDWSQQQQQPLSTCRELDWWTDGLDLARHSVYSVDSYGGRAAYPILCSFVYTVSMAGARRFAEWVIDCHELESRQELLKRLLQDCPWPSKGQTLEEKTTLDFILQKFPSQVEGSAPPLVKVASNLMCNIDVLQVLFTKKLLSRAGTFTQHLFRLLTPSIEQLERLYQAFPNLLDPNSLIETIHRFGICGLTLENMRWLLMTFPTFRIPHLWLPYFHQLLLQEPVLTAQQVDADCLSSCWLHRACEEAAQEQAVGDLWLKELVFGFLEKQPRGEKRVREEENEKESEEPRSKRPKS